MVRMFYVTDELANVHVQKFQQQKCCCTQKCGDRGKVKFVAMKFLICRIYFEAGQIVITGIQQAPKYIIKRQD